MITLDRDFSEVSFLQTASSYGVMGIGATAGAYGVYKAVMATSNQERLKYGAVALAGAFVAGHEIYQNFTEFALREAFTELKIKAAFSYGKEVCECFSSTTIALALGATGIVGILAGWKIAPITDAVADVEEHDRPYVYRAHNSNPNSAEPKSRKPYRSTN